MRTATDSSVIVAAHLAWHQRHREALASLEAALPDLVIPMHAVVESYSVMTRLPEPHRVAGEDAAQLLLQSLGGHLVADLDPAGLWDWLSRISHLQVSGGRTYDARILESARLAGAKRLLTLNPKHFRGLSEGVVIVEPQVP